MKLNEMVEKYIRLRDMKDQIKKKYEAEIAEIDSALDKIEVVLLKTFDAMGIDAATAHGFGTAYKTIRTSATVADRDLYFDWIGKDFPNRKIFLEARCNKKAVEQYKEAHEGDLPPGINWSAQVEINVRRSS